MVQPLYDESGWDSYIILTGVHKLRPVHQFGTSIHDCPHPQVPHDVPHPPRDGPHHVCYPRDVPHPHDYLRIHDPRQVGDDNVGHNNHPGTHI